MSIEYNKLEKNRHIINLYSVRIEDLLRKNGASGNGFKELVSSIYSKLDISTRRNIERMSNLRNRAAHTEFFEHTERDMANFEAQFKSVNHALINMLEVSKQNEELVNSLKVTMAASTGVKKWLYGAGTAALVIVLACGFIANAKR